jgi:hypothetical protein
MTLSAAVTLCSLCTSALKGAVPSVVPVVACVPGAGRFPSPPRPVASMIPACPLVTS